MSSGEFIIVGLVRKAHGIRGELAVESMTDTPDAIFAAGARVFAGTASGDVAPSRQALHIAAIRPFSDGFLVRFDEIPDRNAAELWRGRYLLALASEVPPAGDEEIYLHELAGMLVELQDGSLVGTVEEWYELPQGLAIDVRRAAPRQSETVMVMYDDSTIAGVDKARRAIVVTPPDGLLD